MIGVCQKCHCSGIDIVETPVLLSEIGVADLIFCENYRHNNCGK